MVPVEPLGAWLRPSLAGAAGGSWVGSCLGGNRSAAEAGADPVQGQRCCVLTPTMLPAETGGELTVKSSQSGLGATSLSQWSGQGWVCSGSMSLLLAAPVPSSVLPGQVGLCCLGLRGVQPS